MTVRKDKNTGSWGYEFMYKGIRYHRNFKGASKPEVIGYENIARAELRKKGYDIAADNHLRPLSEIINDYKEFAKNKYVDPTNALIVIDKFFKIIGNKPANDIIQQDIEKYRTYRKKQFCVHSKTKKVSNSSINREVDYIRKCFSIAKTNRKIKENPCDNLEDLRIINPTKRYLTKEEEVKLLSVANPIMRVVIIVALHTGMRCGEIKNLKWSDIFLKEGYLIALNTKNGKPRELLITPQMEEGLMSLPKISEYVFTNPITKTGYKDFKSTFGRTVERAGIPKITIHELRHTTASRLNELGVDLATIQEYLGQSDARTTQRYIHKPSESMKMAVKKLSEY